MILTRVEAKNFLSFESFELALQPGLNVIVGANGAGKSNVLRIASTAFALLREAGSVENFQVRSAGFATSGSGSPHASVRDTGTARCP
jgi:predicted ATPase